MRCHVGGIRKAAAQRKIKAKIAVLERYARDGVPGGAYVPKYLADFRRWEDEALGLERLGSPNTLDAAHNVQLKKRALELLETIAKNQKRKAGRTRIIDTQKAENKRLDMLVRGLTSQLHCTRHDLDQARQNERRWKKRAEELMVENGELLRTLATVTSLRPVEGGGE